MSEPESKLAAGEDQEWLESLDSVFQNEGPRLTLSP